MKRMFMRIGLFGLHRCRWTLLWCLIAAGLVLGEPVVARAQANDQAKATQQLFEAVHANDFAAVQASIAAGADVEASDRWGMTPTELAIDKGYFEIGHYLVAVRNFNRANSGQRPAPTVSRASPFDAVPPDEVAARPSGPSSPLGPMTKRANGIGSGPSASSGLDLETSAGRAADKAGSTGKDNPFDPNAPAYGSGAFSVGETADGGHQ